MLFAWATSGCIALGVSSIADKNQVIETSVPVDMETLHGSSSAEKLTCGTMACTAVPITHEEHTGRSKTAFWLTWLLEGSIAGGALASTVSGGPASGGAGVVIGLSFLVFGIATIADPISYLMFADSFHPYGATPLRLSMPVAAEFDGKRAWLSIDDVLALGNGSLPRTISLSKLAAFARPAGPPNQRPLQAPAPDRHASVQGGKLAVLDFHNYAKELRPENVLYFTDVVRSVTLDKAPGFDVMTRENLLVLLKSSGRDLANCEGECEVDTGRRIGADVVISGDIQKVGSKFKLSLRLHETHDGRLVGAALASGGSIDELDADLARAAARLVESLH